MTSLVKYLSFLFLIFSIIFVVNGCTEDVPELSRSNQIVADSIIRIESKLIIKEVDSLCKLAYKRNFDVAVDSVSKVRLEEIEKYIPAQ